MIHTVNHFGPFYLTYLLFDLVTSSKEGRIINVASSGHYLVPKNDFLHDLNSEKVKYKAIDQYFRSKLLNVMFTCELKNLLLKK